MLDRAYQIAVIVLLSGILLVLAKPPEAKHSSSSPQKVEVVNTVDISGTVQVDDAIDVKVTNTPDVSVTNTPDVNVANEGLKVSVTNTPDVNVDNRALNVNIENSEVPVHVENIQPIPVTPER